MREILFRGKCAGSGKWVYGDFIHVSKLNFYAIYEQNPLVTGHFVDTETVGQYIGMTDVNGKKIFEGDIVALENDEMDFVGEIVFLQKDREYVARDKDGYCSALNFYWHNAEVVGNIYDNPELIKDGEQND